jgi:tetratricopeptide (TPR) repeat protein
VTPSPLTPSELEYTRLAVERGLVTARQVHECAERRRAGDLAHVAGMLTRAGHLDPSTAAALQREVHRVLAQRTALELAADMERYLDGVQRGATGGWQAPRRRRRLASARVAAGLTAVGLVVAGGALTWTRFATHTTGCGERPPGHELETFVTEVGNVRIGACSQLVAAAARRREGELELAQTDAEEALRLLGELPLLPRDFSPALRPALEQHLREQQPVLAALYRDAHLELGRIHAARGGAEDLDRSLAALQQALVHAPGSADVLLEVGGVHALRGELERARGALRAILDADPAHVAARLELGRVHERSGDHEAALACYTDVIERGERPARAHLLRGQARLALGRPQDAVEDLERAVAIQDDSFQGYLWLGRALLACGRTGEAQEALTEAIDLNPALPDGYAARGELYASLRKHDQAIKDFEVALSRSATHHPARVSLARALADTLDYDRARACYEEVLQATDREARALAPDVHAALGELSLVQADPFECEREARAEARRRAAAADDTLGPWPPLARTHEDAARLRGDRLRAAAGHLGRALALAPEHAPALVGRARLALADGALDRAQADLHAAAAVLERRPRDAEALAKAQALLGLVALRRGQPDAARAAFERALAAHPACALASAGVAHAALLVGDAERARAQFARARALNDAGVFTLEGERHAGLGRRSRKPDAYAAARLCFARAVHDNPLDARADLARAQLCAEWRSWDEAVALAGRAVVSDPLLREGHERLGYLFARDLPLSRDPVTGHPAHLRDPSRALAHFDEALALAGDDVAASFDARFGRAVAGLGREPPDPAAVRADLREALRALPLDLRQTAPARVHRAIEGLDLLVGLQERAGDLDSARDCRARRDALRVAARAAAQDELKAAEQLRDRLDYSKAIERLDRALALDPELAPALQVRGRCYLKVGNFVPGILDLSRAVELDPRYSDAFFQQVYHVSYIVDLNRVVTELTKIVSDHPDVAHVIFLRGFFYVAKTEFKRFDRLDVERGLADLDRCLALNPRHVTALLYRGLLHFKAATLHPDLAGKLPCYERALADYQAALALDPASGISHYLQAAYWSVRAAEDDLAPGEVTLRKQRALDALRASLALGFEVAERVKTEKAFDPIRREPALVELLRGR